MSTLLSAPHIGAAGECNKIGRNARNPRCVHHAGAGQRPDWCTNMVYCTDLVQQKMAFDRKLVINICFYTIFNLARYLLLMRRSFIAPMPTPTEREEHV
jgi:hypothetical protein